MSEEKLRALLAEAREALMCCRGLTNLGDRIDVALAEPVVDLQTEYERDRQAWDATAEKMDALIRGLVEHRSKAERERDEARAALEKVTRERDWYLSELRECKP